MTVAFIACDRDVTEDPLEGLTLVAEDPSDGPIAGLDPDWMRRFTEGDAAFDRVFRPSQGLGTLYVRPSCPSCHQDDGRGPGIALRIRSAEPLRHGQLVRSRTTDATVPGITAPPDATVERRLPPAVFGRGYLDAIDDEEIRRVAKAQAAHDDGVRGTVAEVPVQDARTGSDEEARIGRFGVKARIATLDEFVADAYVSDMGLTSPMRPEELPSPEGTPDDAKPGVDLDQSVITQTADYIRLLAIPPRTSSDPAGASLFEKVGCATCHVPSLRTRADYPAPALAGVDAPVYTDLLLHDMGADLADGIEEHEAGPQHFRTAPLIGLRHLRAYLHDGRARSVDEAIRAHAGEATRSVQRFVALSPAERETLVTFVEHL